MDGRRDKKIERKESKQASKQSKQAIRKKERKTEQLNEKGLSCEQLCSDDSKLKIIQN